MLFVSNMARKDNLNIGKAMDTETEIPAIEMVDLTQSDIVINKQPAGLNLNRRLQCTYDLNVEHNSEDPRNNKKYLPSKNSIYICRICLLSDDNMVSLMSKIGNVVLADMFYYITSFEVSEETVHFKICGSCQSNLIYCYRFKIKCIESNNTLTSKLGTKNVQKQKNIGNFRSAGKIDKETQTCIDNFYDTKMNTKILQQDAVIEESLIKIELDFKTDINDDLEGIEYLEEDKVLLNEIKNSTNILEKNNKRQQVEIEATDSNNSLQTKETNCFKKIRQLSCSVCLRKFDNPTSLRSHKRCCCAKKKESSRICKPKNEFACGPCKEWFSSEKDLHIHSALHYKGNQWKCNQCEKEFTERFRFRRHIRRHMESSRWECVTCTKTFPEFAALRRHARVHTGEKPDKKHECEVCHKRFSDTKQLSEHSARHTGVRPCSCEVCGKSFASLRLLASHSLVHSDQKPYPCSYCDKRFRQKSTLNVHHRTHTGEKPYICATCGKSFIQSSNLRLHTRTHTGERPYTCEVCGHKFSSGSALRSHRLTHTGEKPHSCPVCNKRFARIDLKSHMRLHTGERPFACCVCHKKFVNAARLREHNLIHTGEKPFQCDICTVTFKKKIYLAKHLKVHEKKMTNKGVVRQIPYVVEDNFIFSKNDTTLNDAAKSTLINENEILVNEDVALVTEEIPLEVSEELILQDDSDVKAELVVVDDDRTNIEYENGEICLSGVNYGNNNLNINGGNLVAVNEGEVNISTCSVIDGPTVKLYQLDESLVQIQTSGSQVTIRKITSQMTTNF